MRALLVSLLCAAFLVVVLADEHNYVYEDREVVILWVNMVGPYHNPQETYSYYILPFCKGTDVVDHRHENLGEAILGYELSNSGIGIRFKEDVKPKEICKQTLDVSSKRKFEYAVLNQYWYQMFLDNLPVWGMVGEVVEGEGGKEETAYVYTHKKFVIAYNGNQIIEVNLTSENPEPIAAGTVLTFTYSVEWVKTNIAFETRFNKYLDYNFFEHQIHWFSIFNSFMMVIFLVGLVAMILMRTLKRDFARYAKEDDDDFDVSIGDDSGWKQVYGDVFRAPPRLVLFSALLGTGFQFILLVFVVIFFAMMGSLWSSRGAILTAGIFAYAALSIAAGFYSGSYYKQNNGDNWIKTLLITAGLYPGLAFGIAFMLNFIAISYGSLAAIPFVTMIVVVLIWAFMSFPMVLVGTLLGKNMCGAPDFPFSAKQVPRHIPDKKWYMEPIVMIHLGGVLPFGSIFIEMYFIFTSFWHYKFYYVYCFMLLVYVILIIVSMCVTIVSTYFLLNAEDYRWQWMSFLSSASTAGYVYVYSIYYFLVKTRMTGLFQTAFYFGYTAIGCIALAILCGTIGYLGASIFVRKIYSGVKVE
jgi:transmembrane 9 superfamily protein 3